MFIVVPKEASTCRSKSPKGELIERTYDCVIASRSLKGKITQMEDGGKFRVKATQSSGSGDRERQGRCKNGMSKRCQKHCLATVEAACKEEAQRKEVVKKIRKRSIAKRQVKKRNCSRSGCKHYEEG